MLQRIQSLQKNFGVSQGNCEDDVRNIEDSIDVKFPNDYREFLLTYNGGVPEPSCFLISNHPEEILPIQLFFGIETSSISVSIIWNFKNYRDRVPDNLLPIGCSDFNDLICLDLYENNYGHIVFWDLTGECGKHNLNNVYEICDSFSDFLSLLIDMPSEIG